MEMRTRSLKSRFASAISTVLFAGSAATAAAQTVLAEAVLELKADTAWVLEAELPLNFPTYHPQGMTRAGSRWFLSSVEVIDRANEEGRGHLFAFDSEGNLLRTVDFAEGSLYHPGGIDYDGESIWLPLAEYRPDSSSIVYRIDPETFEAVEVFRFADHLGAVAHLSGQKRLVAVSWGSRRFYEWRTERTALGWAPVDPANPRRFANPSQYVAYQDLQTISGTSCILASGVRKLRSPGRGTPPLELGGLDLLELPGSAMRNGIPLNLAAPSGIPVSQNPFYAEEHDGAVRLWFAPEDGKTTLYAYTPR